jgi:hypothetical protein
MKILSQRDPIWALDKLGASSLIVGRFGCTTTCISMVSDYFDCYKSPTELAHDVNNYTKDGLILWQNLAFQKMRFVRREYGRNNISINQALDNPVKAVIFEVDKSHWVVGLGRTFIGDNFTIIDPWDGKKKSCFPTYKAITGAAYFETKLGEEPKSKVDIEFGKKLGAYKFPFFLQVEARGELWYIDSEGSRTYIHPDNLMDFLKTNAVGISNNDLEKVPIKK